MYKKLHIVGLLALLVLAAVGCHRTAEVDPLLRARADGLNREAFLCRYRNPERCIALSEQAVAFMRDSLPAYHDGELRARNNAAFAYFLRSDFASASAMLDEVEHLCTTYRAEAQNAEVEEAIATLLRARLAQRNCEIAQSYRLLYELGRSGVLGHSRGSLLYNYAQTEYYITMMVLNFHYRDGREADVRTLIDEVEQMRSQWEVDYAQDMALNYALAYALHSAGEDHAALDYCELNYRLLERVDTDLYHLANTMQMEALALKSLPGSAAPEEVLELYDEARQLFFDYGDPYQMMGGVVSTARYALLVSDTAAARRVLSQWMELRGVWTPFNAPKMELSLFDLLVRSGVSDNAADVSRWFAHYCELQEYIHTNEREDFALQQSLASAQRRSRWMSRFAMATALFVAVLAVLVVLLWLSRKRLRREKEQIEEANWRDVERIAGVETALSVMRHDVSPFTGYLSRPDLDPTMRNEILTRLLRTFDNVKNWTSLSVPSGMAFRASVFALQEVLDDVRGQVMTPPTGVELRFESTRLEVWADRLLLVILLRNLVNNALQHTQSGNVVVSATTAGGMVDIHVTDTGCGMSAEQCEALFRADRELPPGSEHGFGLILCRYIIKKHDDLTQRGCKLWVESTPGRGTTMHCRVATKEGKKNS